MGFLKLIVQVFFVCFELTRVGGEGWGHGHKKWGPEGWGPKFRAFFFLVPPKNSFFSSVSGGLLVQFWWCLKRREAQMFLGQRATSPYQYAMTTKVGCECIAHAFQGLTELDPEATIILIDVVGVFDLISRRAMLEGLQRVSTEAVRLPGCSTDEDLNISGRAMLVKSTTFPKAKAASKGMR